MSISLFTHPLPCVCVCIDERQNFSHRLLFCLRREASDSNLPAHFFQVSYRLLTCEASGTQ